ncbi:MAG: Gfo/Idh/MocA family oxidoreductase [Candidatus Aenigmatarchaeota archaeon]
MPLKIGLCGFGRRGQLLLNRLMEIKVNEFDITGVYDIDESKKSLLPSNIEWYQDYFKLLSDCNAIIIATSPSSHYKLVKDALEHDIDVLVEKPSTLRYENDLELEKISQNKGKILAVGYSERFNPVVEVAKREINPNEVIFYAAKRFNWSQPIGERPGLEYDLMSHDIDIGYYIFGFPPNAKFLKRNDEISIMQLTYGHINSTLTVCMREEIGYRIRTAEIYLKDKFINMNYGEQKISIYGGPKIPDEWKRNFHRLNYMQIMYLSRSSEMLHQSFNDEPIKRMLICFFKSIKKGKILKPLCSISESKITTKTIEDAFKKIKFE